MKHQPKIAGQQYQERNYFLSQLESEEIGYANLRLRSYNKECGEEMEGYITYSNSANFVVASSGVVGKLNISDDWLQKMQQVHNCLESYRKLLKEITFEEDVKSLPPMDRRNSIIYSILQELFKEIEFQQQNILICQHQISRTFIIYFSDIEMAPISKCCYKNIQIQIGQAIGGRIVCPKLDCPIKTLSTFEIKEELLWQKRYGTPYKELGIKISNYVQSGKYRTKSLGNSIQDQQNASQTQKKSLFQQKTFYQQNTDRLMYDNVKKINNQDSFRFDLIRNILLNSKMFNTNTYTNKKVSQIDSLLSYNIQ